MGRDQVANVWLGLQQRANPESPRSISKPRGLPWRRSRGEATGATSQGCIGPPSPLPATIWLLVLFVVPFYVVVSVAFGTTDFFQNPLPVYQPWYWSGATFIDTLHRFTASGDAGFYRPALFRTLIYVPIASFICLVLGYAVAYYVARYGGRRKGLFLILLISPFWISYLMRI